VRFPAGRGDIVDRPGSSRRQRRSASGASSCPAAGSRPECVEIGEDHGGMCFGGGIQQATNCTFGKGIVANQPYGKLAATLPETMGFAPCAACHELTARAYPRVVGDKQVCIPCSCHDRRLCAPGRISGTASCATALFPRIRSNCEPATRGAGVTCSCCAASTSLRGPWLSRTRAPCSARLRPGRSGFAAKPSSSPEGPLRAGRCPRPTRPRRPPTR